MIRQKALVSIDINSARATRGGDIEETALNTNLEAADEIARQLRLRDIGGLIVIDFIDMTHSRNQREVENRIRDALQIDRARVQLGRISRFGLLEMSRQRLRPSLGETSGVVCPRCNGQGTIRDVESLALAILRLLEEEASKERTSEIRAQVPVSVATFLLNEKRQGIARVEKRHQIRIVVIPNANLDTPHFEVQRLRDDHGALSETSYAISTEVEGAEDEPEVTRARQAEKKPEAAVKAVTPVKPTPTQKTEESTGLLSGLLEGLRNIFIGQQEPTPTQKKPQKTDQRSNQQNRSQQNRRPQQRHDRRQDTRHDHRENSRQSNRETRDGSGQERRNTERFDRQDSDNRHDNRRDKQQAQAPQQQERPQRQRKPKTAQQPQKTDFVLQPPQDVIAEGSQGQQDRQRRPRNLNRRRRNNRPSMREQQPMTEQQQIQQPAQQPAQQPEAVIETPVIERPVIDKPIIGKPVAEKPATEKPVAAKTANKVAEKPAAIEPTVKAELEATPVQQEITPPVARKEDTAKKATTPAQQNVIAEIPVKVAEAPAKIAEAPAKKISRERRPSRREQAEKLAAKKAAEAKNQTADAKSAKPAVAKAPQTETKKTATETRAGKPKTEQQYKEQAVAEQPAEITQEVKANNAPKADSAVTPDPVAEKTAQTKAPVADKADDTSDTVAAVATATPKTAAPETITPAAEIAATKTPEPRRRSRRSRRAHNDPREMTRRKQQVSEIPAAAATAATENANPQQPMTPAEAAPAAALEAETTATITSEVVIEKTDGTTTEPQQP